MEMLPKTAFSAVLSAAALYGFVRYLQMLHVGRKYGAHQHIVVSEETLLRLLLPDGVDIPGVVYGGDRTLRAKYSEFLRARKDAYIQVAMTNLRPNVYIADPQAIKIITTQKHIYVKDVEYLDRFVGCYGQSLLMAEGEVWRRHRKQTQRAFNEKNIRLVWSETEDIMRRLFRIWDRRGCKEVHIDNVSDVTETLGLLVISMAGFGRRISWDPVDDKIPQGHQMSFSNAVRTVSRNLIGRALIPTWAKNLTKTTRDITTAFSEFGQYLTDMVALGQKSSEVTGDQSQDMHEPKLAPDSLINLLLSANCENTWDGGKGLDDKEVAGNIFLFLFAGHESTAHAISFCLGLLALYPEVQQEVYAQIEEVVRSHGGLHYSNLKDIHLVECVFWESLRLYPVTSHVARIATQDSVVSVARNGPGADENTRENFFIPKGSNIWLSLTAVHYNPTYWAEPEKFRPKRFMEPHNKDAFLAFSTGMRSCIGRRFAEVEGTVALALLLERYEIKIDKEKFPAIPGESALEREARFLNPIQRSTVTPMKVPLVFKRRS
ncbi:cytochrome P450 family protein [Rhizoctonia solani]|uniref:Cytochrome P450 family protein n=1 Tax=Rhizoctonia solani TaxID=456999 RepID=A0A8H8NRW7_9AGAM|nr:cytochrome P450 family protein [Rhizoctonia solani]QRW18784.1 cytochrome P450 family protein [Rhizoctonia solani]